MYIRRIRYLLYLEVAIFQMVHEMWSGEEGLKFLPLPVASAAVLCFSSAFQMAYSCQCYV